MKIEFFSNTHGIFTKMDYILDYTGKFNRLK